MAEGDLMTLRIPNLLGDYYDFEVDSNADGLADGWARWNGAGFAEVSKSLSSAAYHGTYSQHVVASGSGTNNDGTIYMDIALRGRSDLPARGHLGSVFTASAWVRMDNAMKGFVRISELNAAKAVLAVSAGTIIISDDGSSWQVCTCSRTLNQPTAAYLRIEMVMRIPTAVANKNFRWDYGDFYETYTFAKNPSAPEANGYEYDSKRFRNAAGDLSTFSLNANVDKIKGTMQFGLVTEAQMKALRSLWLWRQPLTWTPNLNKLPSTLDIMLDDKFTFNYASPVLGAGYSGQLSYEEV